MFQIDFQTHLAKSQEFMKETGLNLFSKTLFLTIFIKIDDVLQLNQQDVNLSINSFLDKMNPTLDEHAPLKHVNKYKSKFKSKPWMTLPFRNQSVSKTIY